MPRGKAKSSAKAGKSKARVVTKAKVVARKVSGSSDVSAKRLVASVTDKQTKTQIIRAIADHAGLSNQQVKGVFEVLHSLVEGHMKKRGSGEFVIPMLGVKIRRIRKKATKKRQGRNPFTGEEITIPAKPSRDVIKVSAMKGLKQVLEG